VETYRLKAHSKGDDTRTRAVVEPFEAMDPLNQFLRHLSPADDPWVQSLRYRVKQATEKADQDPCAVLPNEDPPATSVAWNPAPTQERQRIVAALNGTLAALMRDHENTFLMGEDILSPYGGAFKATQGLSDSYPNRVRNTPISEACLVGVGAGLGLLGFFPLVEIMFGDFIGLAFDQIVDHAAKFHHMYDRQVTTNLIVRTPMGGGRGYGPTHSQTLDRHFLGVPGLRILAMNSVTHPDQIYRPLMRPQSGPTLVIENKLLYGTHLRSEPPLGWELLQSDQQFPTVWIKPQAGEVDLTLIGYGGTTELLLEASEVLFERHDLVAQALILMQIYPLDVRPLLEVIASAKGVLIVEEGQGFAGLGSEIIAQMSEDDALQGLTVRRVCPPAWCIPSSGPLEKQVLPSVGGIVAAAAAMVAR
jgi:2-oxoisovalerate dehydrogenase E1 component